MDATAEAVQKHKTFDFSQWYWLFSHSTAASVCVARIYKNEKFFLVHDNNLHISMYRFSCWLHKKQYDLAIFYWGQQGRIPN